MDLSNLRPAEGSVKSDNFRRGRDMVQEMVRQPVRVIRVRMHVQVLHRRGFDVVRCHYIRTI